MIILKGIRETNYIKNEADLFDMKKKTKFMKNILHS
jgi:hypothetical protein